MLAKIIMLTIMASFYICYFGKMIEQRKQGISTDQLGKGKEGAPLFIEVTLKLMTYLLPALQVFSICFYNGNPHMVLQSLGIIIAGLGVLVFILSVLQMKDNWRAGVQEDAQTVLVTDGIYSISRNPAFLGFNLMYLGILMSFFNCYLCLATFIVFILFHLQIVYVEEPFLREAFGQDFLNYQKTVMRYLGRR